MSSTVELDLVRRESAIPGLATVLDPEAFIAALRRAAPRADIRTAQITYLRYKPRTDCRARVRLDVAGETLDVDVLACRPDDFTSRLEDRADVPGPLGNGRIVLEDCAMLVTAFPNDPKLPVLQQLADPAKRKHLLRELLPGWSNSWEGTLRPLRYRPGRRYVAELSASDGSRVLLKVCTAKAYPRARRNAVVFESRGPLRISRLLGCSEARHLFGFEWLPGHLLFDLCAASDLDLNAVNLAGAALAELHAHRPDGLASWTRETEAADVVGLSDELGLLCPPLAARARRVARQLAARLSGAPPVRVAVHGDLSARHILVSHTEAGIVDLDWACAGDPADDLGNIIAQAERYALRGDLPAGRVEQLRSALLESYARATTRPPPKRIRLYTAVELFRGARFPFRTREPDWPKRTEALVARAETILNASSTEGE